MSKKGKKEETEIKQVNTDVDVDPDYYNYEEPVVYETKKPSFFKKLFRGKKKVITSSELDHKEDDFYGGFSGNEPPVYQEQPVSNVPVNNQIYNNTPVYQTPVTNNYNVQPVFEEDKPVMSKTIGYIVGSLILVAAVVIVIINFMSKGTEKYYINISQTSITLRPHEGVQITFLTNDSVRTSFMSSDESVVTVNEFGYIQAKGYKRTSEEYMKATITIGDNKTKTYKTIDIYVVPTSVSIPMEDFTVPSELSLKLNEKMLIEISNIVPPNNTRQRFDYISSDSSIADVDGVGMVTGKKRGTATIEVRNHTNKNISKIINITVK